MIASVLYAHTQEVRRGVLHAKSMVRRPAWPVPVRLAGRLHLARESQMAQATRKRTTPVLAKVYGVGCDGGLLDAGAANPLAVCTRRISGLLCVRWIDVVSARSSLAAST